MDTNRRNLLDMPTPQIVRHAGIVADDWAGILWSNDGGEIRELSALGALAWDGREETPSGPAHEWAGFNLLCNAAPTPFVFDGEVFHSIDSFHQALKIPEGTPERAACARSPLHEAQRIARRYHAAEFSYRGTRIAAMTDRGGPVSGVQSASRSRQRHR